ncbi:MAG TPA: glycosyltransferase family 4 protein, partial [Vicinamibacterales bacterium]|nr:glycosyltransferase family 4 protein [Vicinamibacterales bacterium]
MSEWIVQLTREPFQKHELLRHLEDAVDALERNATGERHQPPDLTRPPLFLRSDFSFGVRAGGSVGHIAGVVNELRRFAGAPVLVTTDRIATVDPSVEQHVVSPPEAFWNFRELPSFVLNDALERQTRYSLHGRVPAFIYQRYSVNNFTGVKLSQALGVPLVIEYNGSEVWMARHWGRPLKYERLSERIERLNLTAADLVVVVSRAMRDEIAARGIDVSRVLVNPNGVDADRYSPAIDGAAVRAKYGLAGKTVIGFIGTFGPWHGAEALARAYVSLRASNPAATQNARLLMIGEGARLDAVRQILTEGRAMEQTTFTGLVAQAEGPAYLAACDVLVSPHVPNPDGTPFFGSPTKLFEYMAMGKGIVASRLDQIGEVLEDGQTALLVPPGDVDALASAIARLVQDRTLRECLGADARRVALERHTWREHTRRTIDALAGSVRLQADRG